MRWLIVNVPIDEVDRAQLDGATKGFCRVLVARGTDRIVGASIVFEHADKQIIAVALAMTKWTWAQRVCAHHASVSDSRANVAKGSGCMDPTKVDADGNDVVWLVFSNCWMTSACCAR